MIVSLDSSIFLNALPERWVMSALSTLAIN
jgi:hypothetical protein